MFSPHTAALQKNNEADTWGKLGIAFSVHLFFCSFVFFFFLMFEACSHYSDLAGLCRILYRCCSYLVEMEAMAESWQKSGKTWNMVTGLLCC